MSDQYWPVAGLRLRLGELALRPMVEADLEHIGQVLPADVDLDPGIPMPFDLEPKAARAVAWRQAYWRSMGSWTPVAWDLPFVVLSGDEPIGVQSVEARDFAVLRTVETASWLMTEHRGQGLGKQARLAVLSLAFDQLGAEVAETEALADNAASLRVSRSLGYAPNGTTRHRHGETKADMLRLRLDRAAWQAVDRPEVHVDGLSSCAAWFGI